MARRYEISNERCRGKLKVVPVVIGSERTDLVLCEHRDHLLQNEQKGSSRAQQKHHGALGSRFSPGSGRALLADAAATGAGRPVGLPALQSSRTGFGSRS